MKSEDIYQSIKWDIQKLERKEKINLVFRILPEYELILKRRKRARIRSLKQAKQKLFRDFYCSLAQERMEKKQI